MSASFALSRTTRLINQVFFDRTADETKIAEGLLATTVRLIADRKNVESRAGQAAVVSAFQLIARIGIGIELIVPDVELIERVHPLRKPTLLAALLDLGSDLIPGTVMRTEHQHADAVFVFGDTPADNPDAVVIESDDLSCRLTRGRTVPARPITSEFPLGAIAGGAAAAPIALNAAIPYIERATGCTRSPRPRPPAGPPVSIDLKSLFPDLKAKEADFGGIDAISGGAITNALLAVMLWLPGANARIRVVERESGDLTNVNRYMQLRASDDERLKIDILVEASTETITISGIKALFTAESRGAIVPLADTVLVGVDDVRARWCVQEEWPRELYIGATSNEEAILTTHGPGEPCAGCAHPDPLDLEPDEFIPTISFVSFWAGLLQACALLTGSDEPQPARRVTVYPFALGGEAWWHASELPRGARCAVGCPASRSNPQTQRVAG